MRIILLVTIFPLLATVAYGDAASQARDVMERMREHTFYPTVAGFTKDPSYDHHDGIADFDAKDWRVRLLAIRDLIRLGEDITPILIESLEDDNLHVRHLAAYVLGLTGGPPSIQPLIEALLRQDDPIVRSQAAVSLGQLHATQALPFLEDLIENEKERDVRAQAELAAYRIEEAFENKVDSAAVYRSMEEADFNQLRVGAPPPDFALQDTEGNTWRLSDHLGERPIALIWIFSDWCPVCHGEFHELIELKEDFEAKGFRVFTVQSQDLFRARVMTGQEVIANYWFRTKTPMEQYKQDMWWPHLVDTAGAVGARFGAQPLAFAVHAEWINRPATILIDEDGITRMAYYGTYWGDRPSIEEMFEMMVEQDYDYRHPKRLETTP